MKGELRRKEAELVAAAEELNIKRGRLSGFDRWLRVWFTIAFYNRGWNMAGDFYVCDMAEDRAKAFQEGWLACLKELDTPLVQPAWSVHQPLVADPDLCPKPYLSILL